MSAQSQIIQRCGLIGEGVLTVVGDSLQIDSGTINLIGEGTLAGANGDANPNGVSSLIGELVGALAGWPESVLGVHVDVLPNLLIGEIAGVQTAHEGVLALSWHYSGNHTEDDFFTESDLLGKTFFYDLSGNIDSILHSDGSIKTFTYDVDDNISTILYRGVLKTFTYAVNGDIDTIVVS